MAILVATLIDQAKALSDKRGDASIPDADWAVYANWAQRSLDRLIASLDPAFRFAYSDFTLTSTAAGARKDLSTLTWLDANGASVAGSFAALHGLDLNPDLSTRQTIGRRNFRERNTGAIGWWYPTFIAQDRRYDLRGRTLIITPFEQAAGSYRAYARLGPYLFTGAADATALDWQLEPYDEFIVILMARRGMGIEESFDGAGLEGQRLLELKEEITAEHTRDDGEAAVIADVEDER